MLNITLITIFSLLLLPGLLATVMMLPGVPYMFVVALLFGFIDHFTHLTGQNLAILGGIATVTIIVDQLAGFIAAKWGGAKGKTFLYGIAGVIIGTFVLPLFGGMIGLFIGILIGELSRRHKTDEEIIKGSLKAATAGVVGSLTGIVIDLCLGILFITLFLIFVIK